LANFAGFSSTLPTFPVFPLPDGDLTMAAASVGRGLVILDRDGVINKDSTEFVKTPDEWLPLPGSIEAIAELSCAGYAIAVASNQSGLARGLFDLKALEAMHAKFRSLVNEAGGKVDYIVICPHGPDDGCACRKPGPGMYLQIADHFDTGLDGVPVVGDSIRDLEAALAAGAAPVLVRTGNGLKSEAQLDGGLALTPIYDDLAAFAKTFISDS
jgi:D-glycero-D-manno-heptose 1,7-bisphosphate phosphatase